MLPPENTAHPQRSIRSFVLRAGRMGSGQEKALAELGPQFLLPWQGQALDLDAAFGRSAPRIVEIGFGMGQATAEIAAQRPNDDFLGIEVHTPGVGALLKAIGERGLTNLRIVQHDAVEVLREGIAPGSLAGIHIYFPDPWHKKRHHKRRLIQPDFVRLLATRLRPGGYIHLATDWENYAEQMLAVLSAEPLLQNTVEAYAPRPAQETRKAALSVPLEGRSSQSDDYGVGISRPLTKFEARGIRLGHGVWDLMFSRRQ